MIVCAVTAIIGKSAGEVRQKQCVRGEKHWYVLSKKMMKTIKLNMTFSMGLNFLAIALAISGLLNPVIGALVHNAGSVLVIINSAFLLKWRNGKWR